MRVRQRGVDGDQFGAVVFVEYARLTSLDEIRRVRVWTVWMIGHKCSAGGTHLRTAHRHVQRAAVRVVDVAVAAVCEQR